MAGSQGFSWPTRIIFQWVLTIGLVWLLSTNLEQYFYLTGGIPAYIIIASLLTLMNMIVRPLLHIIFAPFHLVFGLIATILMNWLFLFIIQKIAEKMDAAVVTLSFFGGFTGWMILAVIFGVSNWAMKMVVKA